MAEFVEINGTVHEVPLTVIAQDQRAEWFAALASGAVPPTPPPFPEPAPTPEPEE